MKIYCCGCECVRGTSVVFGCDVYPHRKDLVSRKFHQCSSCGLHVGSHKSGKPLGIIPTKGMRRLRSLIHQKLDPIWKRGFMRRDDIYRRLSAVMGSDYHTANLRSSDEAEKVLSEIDKIYKELNIVNNNHTV